MWEGWTMTDPTLATEHVWTTVAGTNVPMCSNCHAIQKPFNANHPIWNWDEEPTCELFTINVNKRFEKITAENEYEKQEYFKQYEPDNYYWIMENEHIYIAYLEDDGEFIVGDYPIPHERVKVLDKIEKHPLLLMKEVLE